MGAPSTLFLSAQRELQLQLQLLQLVNHVCAVLVDCFEGNHASRNRRGAPQLPEYATDAEHIVQELFSRGRLVPRDRSVGVTILHSHGEPAAPEEKYVFSFTRAKLVPGLHSQFVLSNLGANLIIALEQTQTVRGHRRRGADDCLHQF
jgi:hypothetical protein